MYQKCWRHVLLCKACTYLMMSSQVFQLVLGANASKVHCVQIQATTSAYASSLCEPADSTTELLGWPDSALLPPTCDLPVQALGLSKKVLLSNSFEPLTSTINHVQVAFSVLFHHWPSVSFKSAACYHLCA